MSQKNPSISKGVDWLMIWLYMALVAIGIVSIFSVTYREGENVLDGFLKLRTDYGKQFFFFLISLAIGLFILLTDSKFFTATANIWYALGIFMLLLVFPFHTEVKGTESIIRFGGFQIQPAEICKIFVALALAKYLSRVETEFHQTPIAIDCCGHRAVPALITIAQKETGLALVFFAFFLVMFREGLPAIYLVLGFSFAVLVVATLLVEKNTLAIILTLIAATAVYLFRKQIKRRRQVLITIGIDMAGVCEYSAICRSFYVYSCIAEAPGGTNILADRRENPYANLNSVEAEEIAGRQIEGHRLQCASE